MHEIQQCPAMMVDRYIRTEFQHVPQANQGRTNQDWSANRREAIAKRDDPPGPPRREGDGAGDTTPPTWAEMQWDDVWRGLIPGEARTALMMDQANKLLEPPEHNADMRYRDDKKRNGGTATFL